jgi:hypothetical protein
MFPVELIQKIGENMTIYDNHQLINTCKLYHKIKINTKYIVYDIYSDSMGYPIRDLLCVCDTLEICKTCIKHDISPPVVYPAYKAMNKNNDYTIFENEYTDLGNYNNYAGRGYIINEILLNKNIYDQ